MLLVSCVRERDFDTELSGDASFALFAYDDAINIINEAATLNTGDNLYTYRALGSCAIVTNSPGYIVVDFDTINCLCNDGRNRRGKVICNYTGVYKDSGESRTITFENYYVNDHLVSGTEIINALGNNENLQPEYTVSVDGVISLLDTAGTYTYKANLERTWVQGSNTVVWGDDLYELTGEVFGNDKYRNYYAMKTVSPISKPTNLVCKYLNGGVLEIQQEGRTFRKLDYGNGDCDDDVTVTIDNKTHNLKLQ